MYLSDCVCLCVWKISEKLRVDSDEILCRGGVWPRKESDIGGDSDPFIDPSSFSRIRYH